ncbi:universal stress protein [Lentzea sp. BCCO 10_0856]|uniref:Universal stress protein n=1 Tax=Lentzea miocenica TaxID=3095431 RepID=A0ABU4T7X2_9PSEU|nr:universal stress protein [Lentzea sp. BCCO 10_0856]MDX8034264.1 universal stress protein [Lentzea sp. BCCO 10_0856]
MGADRAGLDRALRRVTVPVGHSNVVVAGVDGSESSLRAVRWAAEEAVRRGAELRLVHAELPLPAGVPDASGTARRALHDEAMAWMHDAAAAVKKIAPALDFETRVEVTAEAWLLEQESETAAVLVVGSRGLGGFTGLPLGSVAIALSSSSRCPVVIVRGEECTPDAPVIAGVDGAPENWLVVDRAFEEAAARGTSLVAVHAWTPPFGDEDFAASVGIRWSELGAVRESRVAQRLAACAHRHPDVLVEQYVLHGSPAARLVEFGACASLLVVGLHGGGRPSGMELGATSHAVMQFAPCPVLLVRPGLTEQVGHTRRVV